MCNNTISKDPSTHQVCSYTTLWNVSDVHHTVFSSSSQQHKTAAKLRWLKDTHLAMLFAQHPVTTVCHSKTDWMQYTNTMPDPIDHITFISTEAHKHLS